MANPDIQLYGKVKISKQAYISAEHEGLIDMIDTYDRPWEARADANYAEADAFANKGFEDKPGKRLPRAKAYFRAGVGRAAAKWSVFSAEAKGPNASVEAEASTASLEVRAFANAELVSAYARAGPLKAKVGLSAETGVGIGPTGLEVKILGTGASIGRKVSISLLGNGIEFDLW